MEAVGAAAAIAELSGLSLRAGKAAKNLMQSFVHAPAEITELDGKIERLHLLIQQIDLLCADLPSGDSDLLFPPQHRALISLSLQRTLDSLLSLKSSGQTPYQNGVRARIRWAAMDRRKAQHFLQSIQVAESELDFPLQVLTIRLATINQNSIADVAAGQARLQSALLGSVEEIKMWVSQEVSRLQGPVAQARNSAIVTSTRAFSDKSRSASHEETDDPVHKLFEHNIRRTLSYHEVNVGSASRQMTFGNGWSSVGAAAILRRKRNSTKIKFLISIGCKLFGATILKGELQLSINCRFWRFEPHIASSITALNLRPTHSPIFVACRTRDLDQVRCLLNTGEASIYDVDEELGGLLEHVVYGKIYDTGEVEYEDDFRRIGQRMLEHLLDRGCDAGLYLEGSKSKKPAVLLAFEESFRDALTSMLSHGADLNDFGSQPAGLFGESTQTDAFIWKIRLLRSLGYSDWQSGESMESILYGACWHCHMDLVCFALEVAGIDPNLTGGLDRAPVGNAAQRAWLEGVAVLVTAGARVNISDLSWNGTPLIRSLRYNIQLDDMANFLLLQGANPNLRRFHGTTAWGVIWNNLTMESGMVRDTISYIDFGNSLAHLLHHGADPFEIFTTRLDINPWGRCNRTRWFDDIGYVRASDVSLFFSQELEEREETKQRVPKWPDGTKWRKFCPNGNKQKNFHWDYSGNIFPVHDGMYAEDADSDSSRTEYSGETQLSCIETVGWVDDNSPDMSILNNVDYLGRNEGAADQHEDSGEQDMTGASAGDIDNVYGEEPGSVLNATSFYHHIAAEQGRRQLSRWPLVRVLCDALQHSGFRAEMDDEGDIWYDCGDGDRYFDAWEYQDADQDDETWLPKACPICQDFEGYGLGHILETAERARAQYYEYKDKVKQGKMSMCL